MRTIAENANDFADLRTMDGGNCIYVDKTDYFHRLVTDPGRRLFFIARPRRFGKSLMVTTFKYIFEGRRELFRGLKIDAADYDWKVHPVIHLDFSLCARSTHAAFMSEMPAIVKTAITKSGYAYDASESPSVNFLNAIEWHFAQGTPCVVLIDEYDDPVARALANPAEAELIRDELAGFYGKIKDRTHMIRFLMITGVSKFTKMSVFSALSNLTDISPLPEYAEMLGYTEEELDEYFGEHMAAHAKVMGLSDEAYRAELKRWYNGYRFARKNPVTVYNPVSIALTLVSKDDMFRGHWSQTGRASSLMNVIRREGLLKLDYENLECVNESAFDVSDLSAISPVGMLFQTGYLTIKEYSPQFGDYTLGVPDEEVRRDLTTLVSGVAANRDMDWAKGMGSQLLRGRFEPFFEGLKALYAGMAYGSLEERAHETSYARCLSFLLAAHGFRFRMEDVQADGRADIVAEHPCGVYVFELKVDEPASAALAQVKAKNYDAPYRAKGLPIYAVGLSFDSKTRLLADAEACAVS